MLGVGKRDGDRLATGVSADKIARTFIVIIAVALGFIARVC